MLAWLLLSTTLVTVAVWHAPRMRAVLLMACGLILGWILIGGWVQWHWRDRWRQALARVPLPWPVTFVLACTGLALIEEAITTTMTNCAPLFGVPIGAAYITASSNWLDVVMLHSVVAFVPLFAAWAVLLHRWDFSPTAVFWCFGCTGMIAECQFGGWQHLGEFAMWIPIYGLMVWLPAGTIPATRRTRPVHWWHLPLAVVLVFLGELVFPLLLLVHLYDPNHPSIHFPPIVP